MSGVDLKTVMARVERRVLAVLPVMTIRQLAAVLVLATALPLLLLAFVMYQQMVSNARQAARDSLMSNARALAALVEHEIDTHMAIAGTLAVADTLQRDDLVAFHVRAKQALDLVPGTWLNLVNPSGVVVMSTLREVGEAIQPSATHVVSNAFSARKPRVSDIVEDPLTKHQVAVVEVPVFRGDQPAYLIAIVLNPDRFHALIQNKFGGKPAVAVLDREHKFLARNPDHARRLGALAAESWRAAIARSPEGVYETVTLEGTPSFTAYVTTRDGWIVGLSFPKQVVDAPATRILWSMILIGLAALAASAGLASVLSRRLGTVMRGLATAAGKVGQGELLSAEPLPIVEADAIGKALSAASQELAARAAALTRAHDMFLNLVLHAPFGVYLVDSQFRISQISSGAQNAFATVQPVLGRDLAEVLKAIWPEPFASEAIGRFRHTLATGEPYHQSSLRETRRDTGQDESYDWQIERVTLPSGEHGVVCYYYDLSAQKRAEAALRESEARFRGTFENAAVGVAHVGLDGRWIEVNQRLCQIVGYTREELQSKTFQDVTHPDNLADDLENVRRLLAGEVPSYTMDKRYIRKDGSLVWIGLTVALRRDATGKPLYFISIIRDITRRKAAQDHQVFLQQELAHRLKNQLAVIQAMAGQSARNAGSIKQFQEQFTQRVRGLAVGTDLLIAQGWTGARLDELVQRQLKPFVPAADRLRYDGPSVVIGSDATQAIGLALHELATNAVKHGAWSNARGEVTVSWRIDTEGTSMPRLRLTWLERGGPPVVPPARKGFGHVVIERMVAQKVGGAAELVFAPEGVCWMVMIPTEHFDQEHMVPGGRARGDERENPLQGVSIN